MPSETATQPGVITRVDVEASTPTPSDCLHPDEQVLATTRLSPGWVTVTDRELITYHPERAPAVVRTARPNVTGVLLRRAGGRSLVQHIPIAVLYAIGSLVVGLLLVSVDPMAYVTVPTTGPTDPLLAIVQTFGWAMNVLGSVLVFSALLAVLGVLVAIAYWLTSRNVTLVVEQGDAASIECPTTRQSGIRAVRTLQKTLSDTPAESAATAPSDPA